MRSSSPTFIRIGCTAVCALLLSGSPCSAQDATSSLESTDRPALGPNNSGLTRLVSGANALEQPLFKMARLTLPAIAMPGRALSRAFPSERISESPSASFYSSNRDLPVHWLGAAMPPVALVSDAKPKEGFHWGAALSQSFGFLVFEHAVRIAREPSTRKQLPGKFFNDYFDSVLGLDGWRDGDPFYVNYVGHSMQGAVSGYIQIQNDPQGKRLEFNDRGYWWSRSKAMMWSAAYSVQFELGPISEASIGNVGRGIDQRTGRSGAGAVDLVVTPTLGTLWLIGEDIADRYVIRSLEARTQNRALKSIVRGLFNPDRAFANMLAGKVPWHRDTRGGIWRKAE